jgi:hypothetical protein
MVDSQNRPLWNVNVATTGPDTFLGYPIYTSPDFAAPGVSAKIGVFGDIAQTYLIRRVNGFSLQRQNELYSNNGQVGFRGFERVDGRIRNAVRGHRPADVGDVSERRKHPMAETKKGIKEGEAVGPPLVQSTTEATPSPADETPMPNHVNTENEQPPVRTSSPDTPIAQTLVAGAGEHTPPDPSYTAGGVTLLNANCTLTYDTATDEIRLDGDDAVWTTATIASIRYAVVWIDGTGAAATDPLIAYYDLGAQSVTAANFTVQWDATGIAKIDVT